MNALYGKARQKFLEGSIAWLTDTIKAVLVDAADYAVAIDTHEFLADVPAAARIVTPQTLGTKTSALGVADAADVTFPTATGDQAEAIVLYKDTGTEATSPLIAYIDTATGLPVTPGGGDIAIVWDSGANRIFKL